MPYIKASKREALDDIVETIHHLPNNVQLKAGDLNYLITILCKSVLDFDGWNYTNINSVVGVLECVKLELYRRKAGPYEDEKAQENGDLY